MGGGSVMPRFFIDKNAVDRETVILQGEDARHISLSLRAKPGEKFVLCDADGTDLYCVVDNITRDKVVFRVEGAAQSKAEPTVKVTLYQALVKSNKFDFVVQKAVELGACEIVPVEMANCVSKPDKDSENKKVERWNRIAKEAAMQSGRGIIPKVLQTVNFKDAVKSIKEADCSFVCYEAPQQMPIKQILEQNKSAKTYAFLIGPEGGISQEEAKFVTDNSVNLCSLGPRILRTESAPLCALSAIMFYTDNLS